MANEPGLGLGYKLWWNVRRITMTFLGPAQLGDDDPMERLREERRTKAAEAAARRTGH